MSLLRLIRLVVAFGLLVTGLLAIADFGFFAQHLAFLSADGDIAASTLQMLQLILISLGTVGLALLVPGYLGRLASKGVEVASRMQRRTFLYTMMSTAVVLRSLALLMPVRWTPDSFGYHALARYWIDTGGYNWGTEPTAIWPPAYPFMLSRLYLAFGFNEYVGLIANLIISAATCWLVYRLGRHVYGETTGRVAGIITALFPSQILFVRQTMTEPLFTFLFIGAIILLMHGSLGDLKGVLKLIAGGIVLGLSALTRTLTLLWLPIMLLWWLPGSRSVGRGLATAAIALAAFLIAIAPWIVRNRETMGFTGIATNAGINLHIGNRPGAGFGWTQLDTTVFVHDDPAHEVENDRLGRRLAVKHIVEAPLAFLKRGVLKVAFTFASDLDPLHKEIEIPPNKRGWGYDLLAVVGQSYYYIVLLLAGVALISRYLWGSGGRNPGAHVLAATLFYWAAVHFVVFGAGRFHYPVLPMIAIFAAMYLTRSSGRSLEHPH